MELFVISILDAAAALDPAVYRIIFLLYLPSKQTKIWLKNINEHFVYKRYYDEKLKNLITQNQLEYKRAQWRIYKSFFPKKTSRKNFKNLMRTWVTKGIAKFSKKKQRLHVKHLKKRTFENEKI